MTHRQNSKGIDLSPALLIIAVIGIIVYKYVQEVGEAAITNTVVNMALAMMGTGLACACLILLIRSYRAKQQNILTNREVLGVLFVTSIGTALTPLLQIDYYNFDIYALWNRILIELYKLKYWIITIMITTSIIDITDKVLHKKIKQEKEEFKNKLKEHIKKEQSLESMKAEIKTLKKSLSENQQTIKELQEKTTTETEPEDLYEEPESLPPTPEGRDVTIDVDPEKGFYRKEDLNDDEIDFLLDEGYTISSHVPVGKIRQEEFLLKPNRREGEEHFFLVRSVEEYLRPLSREVKVFVSVKPDVVFETPKGKKVAVEVETGTMLRKGKDVIRDKVKEHNKVYGKKWFFVVTDRKYAHKYREFGRTYTRKSVAKKIKTYFNRCSSREQTISKNIEKPPTKKRASERVKR